MRLKKFLLSLDHMFIDSSNLIYYERAGCSCSKILDNFNGEPSCVFANSTLSHTHHEMCLLDIPCWVVPALVAVPCGFVLCLYNTISF